MIRTLTTEWFWGAASLPRSRRSREGLRLRESPQRYASSTAPTNKPWGGCGTCYGARKPRPAWPPNGVKFRDTAERKTRPESRMSWRVKRALLRAKRSGGSHPPDPEKGRVNHEEKRTQPDQAAPGVRAAQQLRLATFTLMESFRLTLELLARGPER